MADPVDLARELLARAQDDEAAAGATLDVGAVSDEIVGFLAQQAVEKALKAVLAARAVEYPFTHDIGGLIELCEGAGLTVPATLAEADRLSEYAVRLRYGRDHPGTVSRELAHRLAWIAVEWASEQFTSDAGEHAG